MLKKTENIILNLNLPLSFPTIANSSIHVLPSELPEVGNVVSMVGNPLATLTTTNLICGTIQFYLTQLINKYRFLFSLRMKVTFIQTSICFNIVPIIH